MTSAHTIRHAHLKMKNKNCTQVPTEMKIHMNETNDGRLHYHRALGSRSSILKDGIGTRSFSKNHERRTDGFMRSNKEQHRFSVLFLVPCSSFLISCSLCLVPRSLFLVPRSSFLVPRSLFLVSCT